MGVFCSQRELNILWFAVSNTKRWTSDFLDEKREKMKNAQTTPNAKTLTAAEKRRNYYLKRQGEIRDKAIKWQNNFEEIVQDWEDLAIWSEYFTKMGRRYGLLKEFHENGIC